MSIEALIFGRLHQRAEQRTSKIGRLFVTAKARAAAGDSESLFVNVMAFGNTACAALLALEAGDSLALAGTLRPGAWTDREGNARPSLDVVAAQVLTVYGLKKRREAIGQAVERPPHQAPPGDDFGHDDAWPARGGA
jgi:single-stranded DNA-binding protein